MRCPKCRYISFGTTDRCRNCGYDFSLVEDEPASPDLSIQGGAPVGPLGDLPLGVSASAETRVARQAASDAGKAAGRLSTAPRTDLPLFQGGTLADDAPLVVPPATPRPPLAVRRPGATTAKTRTDASSDERNGGNHRGDRAAQSPVDLGTEFRSEADSGAGTERAMVATVPRRVVAGLIDLAILSSIDGAVVYLTLRVLELSTAQLGALPPVPLVAFLLLLNGGYLAIFTAAGGQTIGKMSTRIRVVPAAYEQGAGIHVPLGTAVVRAAAYFAAVLPFGLGLVPILFAADRRALHDRLADTRVVSA